LSHHSLLYTAPAAPHRVEVDRHAFKNIVGDPVLPRLDIVKPDFANNSAVRADEAVVDGPVDRARRWSTPSKPLAWNS
jgi:hypothetical protein